MVTCGGVRAPNKLDGRPTPKGVYMKRHGAPKKGGAKGKAGAAKKGGARKEGGSTLSGGAEKTGAEKKGAGGSGGGDSLSQRLASLTSGLTFQSESDYPVEPFAREAGKGAPSPEEFAAGRSGGDAGVRELSLDSFLSNATQEQDWQDEEARARAKRFQALVEFLKASLKDVKVYRVGGVEADVYVVGETESGDFAGVKTKVVET
jgi:hypothetical protein